MQEGTSLSQSKSHFVRRYRRGFFGWDDDLRQKDIADQKQLIFALRIQPQDFHARSGIYVSFFHPDHSLGFFPCLACSKSHSSTSLAKSLSLEATATTNVRSSRAESHAKILQQHISAPKPFGRQL